MVPGRPFFYAHLKRRGEVVAHPGRHGAGAFGLAAVVAVAGAPLRAGLGEAPRVADGGVEEQIPAPDTEYQRGHVRAGGERGVYSKGRDRDRDTVS